MGSWLDGVCETKYLSLDLLWRLQSDPHPTSLGLWWEWHEVRCAGHTGAAATWPLTGHLRNRDLRRIETYLVRSFTILAKLIMFEDTNKSIILSILIHLFYIFSSDIIKRTFMLVLITYNLLISRKLINGGIWWICKERHPKMAFKDCMFNRKQVKTNPFYWPFLKRTIIQRTSGL